MGRPIRKQSEDSIYFVTNRCLQARFFFLPSREVNEIIRGLLAYYTDQHDVEIFAFVFMSNHFHMIVRARKLNLHDFMRDLQGQIARRLNKHWGRKGKFFARRYDSSEILDDEMLVEKLRYTLCNPCLSNLVRHPKLWPGLSSWGIHETGEPLVGEYFDSSTYWRLRQRHPEMPEAELRAEATEQYTLEMAKLPGWEDLDDEEYHQKVCETVETHAEDLANRRNVPCLGVKKVLDQHYNDRPKEVKTSPRPTCLASCPDRKEAYEEELYELIDRYKRAAKKLREGQTDVEFPSGTIPPGHLHCVGAPRPRDALEAAA